MEIANNAQEEKPSDDKPTKKDEVKMDEVDEHFFECSICLDTANDAVVSMCGHLFCWPCLYKWMEIQPSRACPVCKSAISKDNVIPIYGRLNSNPQDPRNKIPPRPAARRTETMPRQTISDFMEGLGVQLNNIMHPTLTRNILDGRNVSAINIHDVEMNIGARAVAVNSLNELDETRSSIDDMLEDSLLGIDDNSDLNPDESLGNQSDEEFLAQQQVIAEQRFGEAHDTPSSMEDEDNEFFPDMTEADSEEAFNLSIEDYEENDEDEFHQNEFEHENSTQTDWPSDDEDNF